MHGPTKLSLCGWLVLFPTFINIVGGFFAGVEQAFFAVCFGVRFGMGLLLLSLLLLNPFFLQPLNIQLGVSSAEVFSNPLGFRGLGL